MAGLLFVSLSVAFLMKLDRKSAADLYDVLFWTISLWHVFVTIFIVGTTWDWKAARLTEEADVSVPIWATPVYNGMSLRSMAV